MLAESPGWVWEGAQAAESPGWVWEGAQAAELPGWVWEGAQAVESLGREGVAAMLAESPGWQWEAVLAVVSPAWRWEAVEFPEEQRRLPPAPPGVPPGGPSPHSERGPSPGVAVAVPLGMRFRPARRCRPGAGPFRTAGSSDQRSPTRDRSYGRSRGYLQVLEGGRSHGRARWPRRCHRLLALAPWIGSCRRGGLTRGTRSRSGGSFAHAPDYRDSNSELRHPPERAQRLWALAPSLGSATSSPPPQGRGSVGWSGRLSPVSGRRLRACLRPAGNGQDRLLGMERARPS